MFLNTFKGQDNLILFTTSI